MIRVAQLFTGNIGREIIRRLAGHPELELCAVLVHSPGKVGIDSGTLSGAAPNGVVTTASLDDVIAARPDAAIYSGMPWDNENFARLLRAGINVYTSTGLFYGPGQPEFPLLDAAGREGSASYTAGGNIPGLAGDVFPLFVTGYTGQIRSIRAWQLNEVSGFPSGAQLQHGIGVGKLPGEDPAVASYLDNGWTQALGQSAKMVATALGIECTEAVLVSKRLAIAPADCVLHGSGLLVRKGTVAGAEWTVAGKCGDRTFLTITNQMVAMLGLGDGWRKTQDEPPWRVEIDGEPSIVATFGWPAGADPGKSIALLNASRAMNTIPRLVAAPPGCVTVLDYPAPYAAGGLAPLGR
jgi:4-hydroxy-tetrahydrodipicolinate reductase